MKLLNTLKMFAFATIAVLASQSHAGVISTNLSYLGEQDSPGSITWNTNTSASAANLDFQIQGFASLDGYNNCCTDIFHLIVNSTEIFTGSFNLGGGGWNVVLFNPNSGTSLVTTFGASGDVHNSTQVTWAGGVADISIPVFLLNGINQFEFTYTGAAQGLGDEGWGINDVHLTTVNTPEPSSVALLGLGLLGLAATRRRKA